MFRLNHGSGWVLVVPTQFNQNHQRRHSGRSPTSTRRLVTAQDGAPGWGAALLDQALPQLLELLGQLIHQREVRGLRQLLLEVLQTQTFLLDPVEHQLSEPSV